MIGDRLSDKNVQKKVKYILSTQKEIFTFKLKIF